MWFDANAFCILFRFNLFFLHIHTYIFIGRSFGVREKLFFFILYIYVRWCDDTIYAVFMQMEFFICQSLRFYFKDKLARTIYFSETDCFFFSFSLSTCSCRPGWKGPLCNDCTVYPGCKHGSCNGSAWQCICDTNWGGILCDQGTVYKIIHTVWSQCVYSITIWYTVQSVKLRWSWLFKIVSRLATEQ